jgi:hypothetical protein
VAADLRIVDGNPVWASQAIVPSRDTVVSPSSSPALAAVAVNSVGVFVYVKVDNTGTIDLGTCTCGPPLPATWGLPTLFGGFLASTTATQSQSQGGFTFNVSQFGDSISGPGVNFSFGLSASGRRAWAWSPDGRMFAHAGSPNGNDWFLTIVALQAITRSDGTVRPAGQVVASSNGLFSGLWNNSNFGWAASNAVVVSGTAAGGGNVVNLTITCPEAPAGASYGDQLLGFPNEYDYRVSPCGRAVAILPKIAGRNVALVSTARGQIVQWRSNNVPTSVTITGTNPSITTQSHTANGVRIATGGGGSVMVDDPDCTAVGGGVAATVDRVKASTLPSANLGVMAVGSGVVSVLRVGQSAWVQVPNTNPAGWGNQGERHWCLLAQAYTTDGTTIPKPWNGQATNPPAFPLSRNNCAQRNIDISP